MTTPTKEQPTAFASEAPEGSTPAFRVAIRTEGEFYKAYIAQTETMEGALLVGSIQSDIATQFPELRDQFVTLMTNLITLVATDVMGCPPSSIVKQQAPASETEH